ncbi:MAG: tetratricopeptide repeat protein [Myxococcota bacterium]|nr:tetratricopeptide repeat protein [Myxococcota bacterium]
MAAEANAQKLAEIDEALARFEAQKRWSDYIRTLLQKVDLLDDPAEKLAVWARAGQLYLERSSNQAEAIRCYEHVLELDPRHEEAIARLKEMYEKRRDWEKLLGVLRREVERLPPAKHASHWLQMALLATEKVRKPEVCIELWQRVLAAEPGHSQALDQLAGFYERAREWSALADVLETRLTQLVDVQERKNLLQKLGMVYGDKLSDDAGAARAFARLLEIDPEDRRAQEQLKRRYVALRDWDALEAFYAAGPDRWDELIRILEREAETPGATPQARIELYVRIARLWLERRAKADRAARAYEKVLELDPDHLGAAEALCPLYEAAGDARRLAQALEIRLRHATEPLARVTLLRELGLLYEQRLREPALAFDRFLEAFSLDPTLDVVREDVLRLAPAVDGWARLVEAYRRAVDACADPEALVALRCALGRVHRTVGELDAAIAQFRPVFEERPDHDEARQALVELYAQTGRPRELLAVLERSLSIETDPARRLELALRRASLLEEAIGELDSAIEAYRSILAEHGEQHRDVWRALEALYERRARWADLAAALERRIEIGPESQEELAALEFRLGRLLETHLGERARAVELYREVLVLMPEHDGAREALEALLDDESVGLQAAEILEPIYEVRGDWNGLVRALEVRHRGSTDASQRLELLERISDVRLDRLGDVDGAFDALARALSEAPDSERTLARLDVIADAHARHAALVALLERVGAQLDVPDLARALWLRAATLAEKRLGDVDAAVRLCERVLARDPEDAEVLVRLDALLRRAGRWQELVPVLRRRAELAADPATRQALMLEMATVLDQAQSDPAAAITVLKEVLELDPDCRVAIEALDRLYERLGLWADLADHLDRQIAAAPDEATRIALLLRMADLRERRMGALEAALETYRDVLERDPLNEAATAALERWLGDERHQLAVAEMLEPIYRERNDFERLVAVHEIQASHASSPARRIELLHRIAELQELALDDLSAALATYARALSQDPAHESTLAQLERLAAATGTWERLARILEAEVARVEDAQLASQLHLRAAAVREERLGDVDGAIGHYRRVLELDPTHLEAVEALERLYQTNERYEELAAILLTKAALLPSVEDAKAHAFRAAAIHEEILERPTEAIAVLRRILELDAEELRALDQLIALHLRLGQWDALLEAYARKADVVAEPEEKKRILVEMGAVYERERGDLARAIDCYQRILELDPTDFVALSRLDVLYQQTRNWGELLSVLEREAELASDPNEVLSFRYRIAELWHRHLGEPTRAIDIYRDILEVVPDHAPSLDALEALVSEGREPVAAAAVLEPVYRQLGEWAKLAAVLEVQIAHEPDPGRAVELLHQVAELYEFHLDQPRRAFDAFGRALALDDDNEHTLGSLERLAEGLDAWNEVARLYEAQIERLENEPGRRMELALRTAQIHEVQRGDVEAAIGLYRLVLSVDPVHPKALEALDRLYEATERWPELAAILATEAQVAPSPDDVLALQFRLGQLLQNRLGDIDGAIEQYRTILGAAPEHQGALAALESLFDAGVRPLEVGAILEPLYRIQEQWDRLLVVHEVQLAHLADPDERIGHMHRIADIAEERLGDHARAALWMQRALLENPTDERASADVERLVGIADAWAQLADTYATVAAAPHPTPARVEVARRLARVYAEELGDVVLAEETHRYVLGLDPQNAESLETLDRIYEEHGAHEALATVLGRRLELATSVVDRVEIGHRLADLLDADLDRTDEAIGVYERILDRYDPRHEPSLTALASIYVRRADWRRLYETFERELRSEPGDSRAAEILASMAYLAAGYLDEPERAVALWQKVLDLRGEDPEALSALGDLYARLGRWRELVDVLDREANAADDDALRIAIYLDQGRIYHERLGRDRNALECWERVLDVDPTHTGALFAMADVHRRNGSYPELVDTLHRIVEVGAASLDDAVLESVYMELGHIYETVLGRPADAIDVFEKASQVAPRNLEALEALERLYRADARWEECISVLERRARALDDPQAQVAQWLALAAMWADPVGRPDEGRGAYERVLEIDPLHVEAFERLEALHREAMRWEQLVDLYIARAEAAGNARESIALLRKVAEVQETKLDDRVQAYETLKVAWSFDYTDRATVAELERVARATQRWNDLLSAANEALREVTEPPAKIALCLDCARWYGQELGRPEYAIPYYQQILALDPANVPAMRQMADLYRSTQQWATLAQILGRLVEMAREPSEKAEGLVQLGELAESHLGTPEQATTYYRRALEHDPRSIPALEALERAHRREGRWEPLLDVLRRKAEALSDPERAIETWLQLAEVQEDRLGRSDDAVETYRRVLELDPHCLPALKGLERLAARAERWQELLSVLEAQLDVVSTERERIALRVRVAAMWEEQFLKPDRAIERLEQVLEIDPQHEEALVGLARLYRATRRWPELVSTFERHIAASPDRAERCRLYKAMGEVYALEMGDVDRAIDAYLGALDLNDADLEALDALTRLYERRGEHVSALEMMERMARLASDPARVVDLRYRMGRILDEQLGDRASALEHYQRALDVDPTHLPSLEAKRRIQLDAGDYVEAAKTLEQEIAQQPSARLAARLLVELGRIYEERLDEHGRALAAWRAALEKDPDNEEAALPLAREYYAHGQWEQAFPLLQMLHRRAARRDAAEQHELAWHLGEAATRVGQDEEAVKAFTRAHQLDSNHLPSLLGLAHAHFRTRDWDKAFKFFQMALVHHRDALDAEQVADVFYRLGVIKREQGERRKALNMFDKALEERPGHRPALEALVALYEANQEWEQVIHYRKLLLDVAADADERFALLDGIGDLWKDKVGNAQKAIQSWNEALAVRPTDHKTLHKLLVAYQETRQWEKAIETIERIAELDPRAEAKAKYAYTIGVILRDELKNPAAAVDRFNQALDLDPDQLKAFEAINKILTATKDWKQLERAFRKMLSRVINKGKPELEFQLWHNLGVIYRDRQKNFEAAAEAFKMAARLQPDNAQEHQILAEIYTALPDRVGDAIAEHQWLLRNDPFKVDSYRALYRLYFDARAYDKAWCLAATLVFLKKADQEQQQFYEQYRQGGVIRPQTRLDNESWLKLLMHPDEDPFVGKMLEALVPAVHAAKVASDKALGLQPRHQVDPSTSTVTFARTFGFVAQVLDLQLVPRLFLRQDTPGGVSHVPGSNPPAVVCGSSLLQGYSPQDLVFVCGRLLSYYRGEHFIRTLMSTTAEIKAVLLAGLRLAGLGTADPQVDEVARQLQPRLGIQQLEALRRVAKAFVEHGARTDAKQWIQAVELTACRAGFLLCNDLTIAASMITKLPPEGTTDLPPKDKIKEVVLFSVSEEYFKLRERLGIQIRV